MPFSTEHSELSVDLSPSDPVQKLKHVAATFKRKYEEASHLYGELRSQAEHIKSTYASLSQQYQELTHQNLVLREEVEHLRQDLKASQSTTTESEEELISLRDQLTQLTHYVEGVQGELKAAKERLPSPISSHEIEQLTYERDEARAALHRARTEVSSIRESLAEKTHSSKTLEAERHEFELMREVMLKGLQDAKEKIHQKETHYLQQIHAATTQVNELLTHRTDAEKQVITLKEKTYHQEERLAQLEAQLQTVNQSQARLNEENNGMQHQLEELDARFKTAQQHLAKKVRDNTLIAEKCDEQLTTIADLQKALNQSREKQQEVQNNLDVEQQHQRRLQEQLQELLRSSESQASRWEEKYLAMHEKWQEAESKVRDLQSIEKRYQQLQTLLGNLGQALSSPLVQPALQPLPEPPSRYKQNLFD